MFSQKRNKVGIIEVIIFHKRDRRLCRLNILGKILYLGGIVFLDGNIFTNHRIGAQIERQPDDKSQTDLSENFESAVKPLLVMMFELHVVVEETDSPHPNSRNEHQNHINIIETAHQQTGNKNGNYDDNSPHRGSSLFAHHISIRLPKNLNPFENIIRKQLKDRISRGKIDVFVTYEIVSKAEGSITYHPDMAQAYVQLIQQLSNDFSLNHGLDAAALSRYPDVYTMEEAQVDEEKLQKLVYETVDGALTNFIHSREIEGELLKVDLLKKLEFLAELAEKIEKRSPEVFAEYKERLTAKVNETLADGNLDESVLATELVIYADKICVDEELVRLKSHISHMRNTLEKEETVGRKLDFITQELNREANTTLSKANDIVIADLGIMLKTEIEKIREQIQNLE